MKIIVKVLASGEGGGFIEHIGLLCKRRKGKEGGREEGLINSFIL